MVGCGFASTVLLPLRPTFPLARGRVEAYTSTDIREQHLVHHFRCQRSWTGPPSTWQGAPAGRTLLSPPEIYLLLWEYKVHYI